jgi:type III secretory pathway component EscV
MMVLPVWLLDTFFTINIAVALMVMMVATYMIRPLDFAAFRCILLLTTLVRPVTQQRPHEGGVEITPAGSYWQVP